MRSLSEDGRYLALYLMTCRHCTLAGIFRLPDGYACDDMQWTPERVARGFGELLRKGFAIRCPDTSWVWITKYLDWNGTDNPNQRKAAAKVLTEVPSECCWFAEFEQVFTEYINSKRLPNPSRTPSQPLRIASATSSEPNEAHSEPLANPSATTSNPGSVSGSVSGSGAVSETVAVCVGRGADADGWHAGRGVDDDHLKGNGAEPPEPEPPEAEPLAWPKAFETIRQIYPERSGSQRWSDALKNYTANLKAGYTHQQMLDGVIRYARYCKVEEILGQPKVQTAATFLGPNQGFLDPWKPSAKRETPAERWVRRKQEEAKDANH